MALGRRSAWWAFLIPVCALGACGDDSAESAPAVTSNDAGTEAEVAASCAAPAFEVPGEGCVEPGWTKCPEGFSAGSDGVGCVEVVADTCAAGTMPSLGTKSCTPVGVGTCPDGTSRDATGFGCGAPNVGTCSGASRESFAGCTPIGDCSGVFPPAGATLFVDDSFTAGQLDASHFKTIAAAIAAAPSGAVIAVDEGTYAGEIGVEKSVTITGRCAEKVLVTGTTGTAFSALGSGHAITIGGVGINGFDVAVAAVGGANVTLRDAVIEASKQEGIASDGAGTVVTVERAAIRSGGRGARADSGGSLVMEDAAIAGSVERGVLVSKASTTAKLTRVVVVGTKSPVADGLGVGLLVESGARLEMNDSFVGDSVGAAIDVDAAVAVIKSSVLSRVKSGKRPGSTSVLGAGIAASMAADVTLEATTISETPTSSAQITRSKLTAKDSAFIHAKDDGGGLDGTAATMAVSGCVVVAASGFALGARDGSTMTLSDVFVTGTRSKGGVAYAVLAANTSTMEAKGLSIVDTTGAGLLVFKGSTAKLERTLIDRTKDSDGTLGFGLLSEQKSDVMLRSSAVRRAVSFGMSAKGAKLTLENVSIHEMNEANDGLSGMGILAIEGSTVTAKGLGIDGTALAGIVAGGKGTQVTASELTIARTRSGKSPAGRGIGAQDGARVEITTGYLLENVGSAAVAYNANLIILKSRIADTQLKDGAFGHGAVSIGGRLELDRSVVSHNPGAGAGFLDATGLVNKSRIEENGIGLNTGGASKLVNGGVDVQDPQPSEVLVSSDTELVDNDTRTAGGELPVPSALSLP